MIFFNHDNKITFKNETDIYNDSIILAEKLKQHKPSKIIAIANSGTYISYLVAKHLNVPLDVIYSGSGKNRLDSCIPPDIDDNSVFIDDSIASGDRYNIVQSFYKRKIKFACLYTHDRVKNIPISYVEVIKPRRYFFYNIFKHNATNRFILDLDGVICVDPVHNDTTIEYTNELVNIKPLYIPRVPVLAILTNRLEIHRDVTVNWLKKYNVNYKYLLMCPTYRDRIKQSYKCQQVMKLRQSDKALLYIDSHSKPCRYISRYINCISLETEKYTMICQ